MPIQMTVGCFELSLRWNRDFGLILLIEELFFYMHVPSNCFFGQWIPLFRCFYLLFYCILIVYWLHFFLSLNFHHFHNFMSKNSENVFLTVKIPCNPKWINRSISRKPIIYLGLKKNPDSAWTAEQKRRKTH